MTKSVLYSATITLLPKLYKYKPEEQYDRTYIEVIKRVKALNSTVTAVAELTRGCNIHMHLMLQFKYSSKNYIKDFYDLFRNDKLFGFINIKQITDDKGWVEYMSKELATFKEYIGRPPVIIDELQVLQGRDGLFYCYDLQDEQ